MKKIDFDSLKRKKRVYVVAEVSANHGQDIDRAIEMIRTAKKCGADAVKFQTYTPETLTININNKYFRIEHPKWGGQTLYQLYKKAYTPWRWFKKLKRAADNAGITFFSTAFDKTSVDFLNDLGVPFHKIASFELVDTPLIEYAASSKKPIIMSTGMSTFEEIKDAVNVARRAGANGIVLLKCVSSYPAKPEQMNLRTIPDMNSRFKIPIGLSDHTMGIEVSIAGVTLGAVMIEKHFTLSRKFKTPDSFFSLEPDELKSLIQGIRNVEMATGKPSYDLTPGERSNRIFRRSIFAVRSIKKGEVFTQENIRPIRPGYGLKPKYYMILIGKKSKRTLNPGEPLRIEDVR